MSNPDILKNQMEENIINLYIEKIIDTRCKDILLRQLEIYNVDHLNIELLHSMIKNKSFMRDFNKKLVNTYEWWIKNKEEITE